MYTLHTHCLHSNTLWLSRSLSLSHYYVYCEASSYLRNAEKAPQANLSRRRRRWGRRRQTCMRSKYVAKTKTQCLCVCIRKIIIIDVEMSGSCLAFVCTIFTSKHEQNERITHYSCSHAHTHTLNEKNKPFSFTLICYHSFCCCSRWWWCCCYPGIFI